MPDPRKLSLTSLLAAACLFVLPWINITCNGKTVFTQSGLDVIQGTLTPAGDGSDTPATSSRRTGYAPLVGLSLLAAIAGAVCYGVSFKHPRLHRIGALLAAVALVLLLVQCALGFPIQHEADNDEDSGLGSLYEKYKPTGHAAPGLYVTLVALAGGMLGFFHPGAPPPPPKQDKVKVKQQRPAGGGDPHKKRKRKRKKKKKR